MITFVGIEWGLVERCWNAALVDRLSPMLQSVSLFFSVLFHKISASSARFLVDQKIWDRKRTECWVNGILVLGVSLFFFSVRLSWWIFRWVSYFLQPQNLWDVGIQGNGHVYRDDETHRFQLGWTWCDCLGSIAVTTDPFSKQGLNGDFLVIFVGWFEGFLYGLLETETWDHFHHLVLTTGIGFFHSFSYATVVSPVLMNPGPLYIAPT